MPYRTELSKLAERQLSKLPSDVQHRIKNRIDHLAENPRPHGVEKLTGRPNAYRIKAGDYRILYRIEDRILLVVVVELGHRREVYR